MNRINKEVILKIIVLFGFALFYTNILKDNSIMNYVHPRIVPFAKASVILMIIIILCLFFDLKKSLVYRKKLNTYIIFALVFIIIFFGGKSNLEEKNNINSNDDSNAALEHTYIENSSTNEDINSGNIIINEKNFMSFLSNVETEDNEYLNNDIEITGFIFRDSEENNNLYLARNVMICCTADMDTVGIRIKGYDLDSFNDDTWVKVIGSIDNSDKNEIVLIVKKIVKIDKPKLPYLYP